MNRRNLLKYGIATIGTAWVAKAAEARTQVCEGLLTPKQVKGPFYPVVDQLDKDADLVQVHGRPAPARGRVVLVEGTVTDQSCVPVAGALVEIWQACESGRYDHPSDPNPAPVDPNFQYWGTAVTDAKGFYRFRTIVPGAYPAAEDWIRPPHIHFKVSRRGYAELISQMYFAGQALNDDDLILQALSKDDQKSVVVEFAPRADVPHPVGVFHITIQKLTGLTRRNK